MRGILFLSACWVILLARSASAADMVLVASDPTGAAGRVSAPVSAEIDLADVWRAHGRKVMPDQLRVVELLESGPSDRQIPAQFESTTAVSNELRLPGVVRWLLPPGPAGQRRFRLTAVSEATPSALVGKKVEGGKYYDVSESSRPVFRYNHAAVPAPQGVAANFSRGDYLHPIYGPSGELLTDDFPKDHPHHRGISWSWPVTRWKDEVRDIWACVGVWSRPVTMSESFRDLVATGLYAGNVWKWGDKDSIVREEVLIRAFRQTERGRFIDIEVRLTALEDGVAIGGRPHGGYGGFGLRAQPAKERKITAYTDPEGTKPRRAWLDYSGEFAGGKGPAGIAILQHPDNPLYPAEYRTYPELNYVMPAFPGEREVPLPKGKTLVLKHRLWIHSGYADEKALADAWAAYTNPPQANLSK